MPFGIIGRTGPGMKQLVGFGDRSTGRGIFGGEIGARHCNQWGLYGVRVRQRRGPLPKLLWADLLMLLINSVLWLFYCLIRCHTEDFGFPISLERNIMYISGQVHCKLQGISYVVLKRHELWSTNGLKLEVSFHPPSINSAFHFIARLCRRRSANGTRPNFAKRWTVNRPNKLL